MIPAIALHVAQIQEAKTESPVALVLCESQQPLGNLGVLYATGHGVEQDLVRSYIYSSLAARHYSVWANDLRDTALRNRDLVASRMTEDQIENAKDQLSYP